MNAVLKVVGKDILERIIEFFKTIGILVLAILIVITAMLIIGGVIGSATFFVIKAVAPNAEIVDINLDMTYVEQIKSGEYKGAGAIIGIGIAVSIGLAISTLIIWVSVRRIRRIPGSIRNYIKSIKYRAKRLEDGQSG